MFEKEVCDKFYVDLCCVLHLLADPLSENMLGKAWVGEGYKVASDGKTLLSKDELRQYRPPIAKDSPLSTTGTQSNFEWRNKPSGRWENNGHLDIVNTNP